MPIDDLLEYLDDRQAAYRPGAPVPTGDKQGGNGDTGDRPVTKKTNKNNCVTSVTSVTSTNNRSRVNSQKSSLSHTEKNVHMPMRVVTPVTPVTPLILKGKNVTSGVTSNAATGDTAPAIFGAETCKKAVTTHTRPVFKLTLCSGESMTWLGLPGDTELTAKRFAERRWGSSCIEVLVGCGSPTPSARWLNSQQETRG